MIFDEIIEKFRGLPNWESLEAAWDRFTLPSSEGGFDAWPFNEDGDGLTPFQEIQNNVDLIRDLFSEVVTAVEWAAREMDGMDGPKKLDLAVDFLFPIIKSRLTGWARPARFLIKPILRHIISAVVKWLNEKFNAVDEGKSFVPEVPPDSTDEGKKEEAPE